MNAERVKEIRERVERRCSWYEAEIEVIGNDHDKEWLGKDLSIERDLLALLDDKEAQLKAGGGGTFGRADTESSASAAPSPGPSAEDFAAAIETLEDELEKHKGTVCVNWVTKMNAAIAVLKHPVPSGHSTAPTDDPYNGPLSGQGVITDEERREMVSGKTLLEWMDCIQCCDAKADGFGCSEADRGHCAIAVERIRALLQSPPKVSVTRPVRFFCYKCGREIWDCLDYDAHRNCTIQAILESAICSDCDLGITVGEAVDGKEGK